MYKSFFKRLLDIILSLIAILLIGWLIAIIAIWLHFANKGAGSFFLQERPGKNGKLFKIIKFKTMTDERDSDGNLLPDTDRLTKVGNFVRSTSMDELPQLFNILAGDMSLVGPRPVTEPELVKYGKYKDYVLSVVPGLTGMWQVSGRSNTGYEERKSFDTYYIQNWSIFLDIWILIKTVWVVINGKGAY